jgi:pimeloyl-ACP methyl ester carboxylesterase
VVALYAAQHADRLGRVLIVDAIPARRSEVAQAFQALEAGRDSVIRRRMTELRAARAADPANAAACRAYYILWFTPFFADSAMMHRSRGDFCAGSPAALTNKLRSVDCYVAASLGDWDWTPLLRNVAAPALVIHGSRDPLPLPTARVWASALPNSRLIVLDGLGHFPYIEAPAEFFAIVDTFLRGDWPQGAQRVVTQ